MARRAPGVVREMLDLDEVVHQRTRLMIIAMLNEVAKAEFTSLRDELGLTAGNLARHLRTLEDAGLVVTAKEPSGARTRTWVSLTRAGRTALSEEIRRLRALVARVEGSSLPLDSAASGEIVGPEPVDPPDPRGAR